MSEPIKQHIVPKCYLQNFAVEKRKDEFFVDVFFNKSNPFKIHRLNIKNICKIREFYTFDGLPEGKRRWLENYYGRHVESMYRDIYKALIDPEVDTVSPQFKLKILVFIIAQELRTPKLAEALNSISKSTIEYAFLAHDQLGTEKKVLLKDNEVIDLEGKTIEEAIQESSGANRQASNLIAVKRLKQIAELKMDYHILVTKYECDDGSISSDRPVHASLPLYSPNVKIHLPIDRKHMVSLYPYDPEIDSDSLKILRVDHELEISSLCVSVYNTSQVEKADRYLYGDEKDITQALAKYESLRENNGVS